MPDRLAAPSPPSRSDRPRRSASAITFLRRLDELRVMSASWAVSVMRRCCFAGGQRHQRDGDDDARKLERHHDFAARPRWRRRLPRSGSAAARRRRCRLRERIGRVAFGRAPPARSTAAAGTACRRPGTGPSPKYLNRASFGDIAPAAIASCAAFVFVAVSIQIRASMSNSVPYGAGSSSPSSSAHLERGHVHLETLRLILQLRRFGVRIRRLLARIDVGDRHAEAAGDRRDRPSRCSVSCESTADVPMS